MKVEILGIITVISGFNKLGEIISEALYIKESQYAAHWIYLTNISLMILPYIVEFLFFLFWGFCIKSTEELLGHILLALFALTHPLGLGNLIIGCYMFTFTTPKNKKQLTEKELAQKENLNLLNFLSKSCTFIECVLQSIPQTALKTYNNYLKAEWTILGIITICFSVSSALISIMKVALSLDKENKMILKKKSESEMMSSAKVAPDIYDNTFFVVSPYQN